MTDITAELAALPKMPEPGVSNSAVALAIEKLIAIEARLAIAEGLLTAMEPTLFAILDGGPDCDCDAQHVCGWSSFSKAINEARAYLAHRTKETT